jgi:TrmH family RNA methyltransferase
MTFQVITSSKNNKIKELVKLQDAKYRRESASFVVENLAIIRDAQASGSLFSHLFVTGSFYQKNQTIIEALLVGAENVECYLIDEKINQVYSELSTPSGITALYSLKSRPITDHSVVYLAGISDPGNLGTIMRSALAFGLENLVLSKDCVDPYCAKTISAAKDAIFKINILEDRDEAWLNNCSLPIYATSSHEGELLPKIKAAKKFCLILGSESQGVPKELLTRATQKICIPISKKIESLNVAAAAAILFYELQK